MKPRGCRLSARWGKAPAPLAAIVLLAVILSACASPFDASTATQFGPSSDKAIVLIGTSVSQVQDKGAGTVRRLETYWQQYDPSTLRLRPEGRSFITRISAGAVAEPAYLIPTVSVLEVDPGSYALIGAGFPHLMTLYVPVKDTMTQRNPLGRLQSWTHTVDPRRHVDPEADVKPRANMLFSVEPGQVVYLGHIAFKKPDYIDTLRSMDYYLDEDSAREALKAFPGISGEMITLDLRRPAQSVSR